MEFAPQVLDKLRRALFQVSFEVPLDGTLGTGMPTAERQACLELNLLLFRASQGTSAQYFSSGRAPYLCLGINYAWVGLWLSQKLSC